MKCQRLVWILLACCLVAGIGAILFDRGSSRQEAPRLTNAYADLTEFWRQAADSLEIAPEEGRLQQWNIGYDLDGQVLFQTFKLYIDRGPGTYDVYYYSQDNHERHEASWSRQRVEGSAPAELVPAHLAFAAVNRIGLRELERHQNLEPPVRFWFFAQSGSGTYKPIAGGFLVQGSEITPIELEGVTISGDHGTFGIAEGAVTTSGNSNTTPSRENPGPSLFVVPLSPVVAFPAPAPDPPPRTLGPVPEVLARPIAEGGPQRTAFMAGDTISKIGAYFLNVETGAGEAWVYPEAGGGLATISDDNRFVWGSGYVIDRSASTVWQYDDEAVLPLLFSDRGFLFAELERQDLNLRQTGRLFWTGLDFKPVRTITLDGDRQGASHALLSPDGQQLALLARRQILLVDLSTGEQNALEVPGAGKWTAAAGLAARDGGIKVSVWFSEGNPSTDTPRWNELIRVWDWQGHVQSDLRIPGSYTVFSPDGKWVAWEEQDLLGHLAPVTVVAEAASLRPHLRVLGATPCFATVGSGGNRWLADSSGLVLATTANGYRLLTLDGSLSEPSSFAGLTWKGEPQPAPDRADRFAVGRLQVVDGERRLHLNLEKFVTPRGADAWGSSSRELRFTLPPKAGGGACHELPAMDLLVLKAGEPVPEFPLMVQSGDCIPLRDFGPEEACLTRGTRMKPLPDRNGRPGLKWTDQWSLFVQTESGQTGWITLSGDAVTWAR
ncbi:MAG TPA: hypothetical protein VD969_09510 [Symbiobacteriaceae bacterium]|nr:hypothetical protein [Symbiobacteriaceae bacterium]